MAVYSPAPPAPPAPPPPVCPPARRIGDYEIQEELGEGCMGIVYSARWISRDVPVALKVLAPRFAGDRVYVKRFLREIRALGRLNHPNVVRALDAGKADGLLYFTMERVDGEALDRRLNRTGRLPERGALLILLQVARALDHAHAAGILHRDVKPSNVLMARDGQVRLVDFGLSRPEEESGLTEDGTTVGTPWYASPEQARGTKNLDARSDLYSVGAMAYHLLSGEPPFTGATVPAILEQHIREEPRPLRDVVPEVSEGTEEIVTALLRKKPADRFPSAAALAAALEARLVDLAPQSGDAAIRGERTAAPAAVAAVENRRRRALAPAEANGHSRGRSSARRRRIGVAGSLQGASRFRRPARAIATGLACGLVLTLALKVFGTHPGGPPAAIPGDPAPHVEPIDAPEPPVTPGPTVAIQPDPLPPGIESPTAPEPTEGSPSPERPAVGTSEPGPFPVGAGGDVAHPPLAQKPIPHALPSDADRRRVEEAARFTASVRDLLAKGDLPAALLSLASAPAPEGLPASGQEDLDRTFDAVRSAAAQALAADARKARDLLAAGKTGEALAAIEPWWRDPLSKAREENEGALGDLERSWPSAAFETARAGREPHDFAAWALALAAEAKKLRPFLPAAAAGIDGGVESIGEASDLWELVRRTLNQKIGLPVRARGLKANFQGFDPDHPEVLTFDTAWRVSIFDLTAADIEAILGENRAGEPAIRRSLFVTRFLEGDWAAAREEFEGLAGPDRQAAELAGMMATVAGRLGPEVETPVEPRPAIETTPPRRAPSIRPLPEGTLTKLTFDPDEPSERRPDKTDLRGWRIGDGFLGQGIEIRDPGARITLPGTDAVNPRQGTFLAWIKRDGNRKEHDYLVFKMGEGWDDYLHLRFKGNALNLVARDGDSSFQVSVPKGGDWMGGWQHLGFTWEAIGGGKARYRFYRDGEPLACGPDGAREVIRMLPADLEKTLTIGAGAEGRFVLDGFLDEIHLVDRPLSPEEIRRHVKTERTLAEPRRQET